MADYKVTDTQLSGIANAIRTKGGTSAPLAFPSAFVSAINNIPSGSSAVLMSKTITQNGTYDASDDNADGYDEVVVNVAGGGGAKTVKQISLLDSDDVLLEVELNGLQSDEDNIGTIGLNLNFEQLDFISTQSLFYDLGETNKSCTIYAIGKTYSQAYNDFYMVTDTYENSTRNSPLFYTRGGMLRYGTYNNDGGTSISTLNSHVFTLSVDSTNKICNFYVDGVYIDSKEFYNSGRYPAINGSVMDGTSKISGTNTAYRYFAVVDGAEDSTTIIANQNALMAHYSDLFE